MLQLFLFFSLFNDTYQLLVLQAYSGTAINYELKSMWKMCCFIPAFVGRETQHSSDGASSMRFTEINLRNLSAICYIAVSGNEY
jgi:hypothetical protein